MTNPRDAAGLPCGHDEDGVRLAATGGMIGYCCRCERAYPLGPTLATPA